MEMGLDSVVNALLIEHPAREVTVERVPSHTAGLAMASAPWFDADTTAPGLVDVLEGGGDSGGVRIDSAPGAAWRYSGGGFALLQLLVTDVTGQDFDAYMRGAVFDPLRMQRTRFDPPSLDVDDVAAPHDEQGEAIEPIELSGRRRAGCTAQRKISPASWRHTQGGEEASSARPPSRRCSYLGRSRVSWVPGTLSATASTNRRPARRSRTTAEATQGTWRI